MQLTAALLLIFSLSLSAHSVSQTVSISGENISYEKIFLEIEKQTGYAVFTSQEKFDRSEKISVNAEKMDLQKFLRTILFRKPYDFQIKSKTIFIKSKINGAARDLNQRLSPSFFSPPITVRGRIVNENNEPVIASVIIKGTKRGTTSDAEGFFELSNVDDNAVLVISSANTETITINVSGKTSLDILVKSSVNDLNEVVINKGYYSEKLRFSTGNVGKVTATDIEKQPAGNPLSSLQGRVPGIYIQQTSGVPGGGFNVIIRGRNSIRPEANDPLYIIDGIPYTSNSVVSGAGDEILPRANPLNNINPNDIEGIEILKDADATSIYGSRGSNGVVLITTKRAKSGVTRVDANFYAGYGEVAGKMDLLNSKEYLQMRNEAFANDGIDISGDIARDLLMWDTTRYTDWQKQLINEKSPMLNAHVSVSGGNNKTRFILGAGYFKEGTVFPGDYKNQKLSTQINLNHSSENNRFQVGFISSFVYNTNNLPGVDLTNLALTLSPVAPEVFDESGKLNWQGGSWKNPMAELKRDFLVNTNNLVSNLIAKFEIVNDLVFTTSVGYNILSSNDFKSFPIRSQNPQDNPVGASDFGNGRVRTWNAEPQLSYRRKLRTSVFEMLVGSTFQETTNNASALHVSGYTSDALLKNPDAAPQAEVQAARDIQYRYQAFFGRANYILRDRYIANITFRRDGSSRFGPEKRFANFGAIGAAWIFSDEEFVHNALSWINFGKVRASFGTTGSDQIPDYGYLNSYSPTASPYDGNTGLVPTGLVNPEFRWESNKKLDAGVDLGFFKDRIRMGISWFRNRSSNQLVGYNLSLVTGSSSIQYNLPATVQNTGVEITLQSTNIKATNFSWSTGFNVTIPRNKLIEYENIETSPNATTLVVGKPLTIRPTFQYIGVNPSTGVYDFKDFNDDDVISSPDDDKLYKNVGQRYYGGLINTFVYKSWNLDVLFQFVKQTGIDYMSSFAAPGSISNFPVEVLSRWKTDRDITNIQRFTASSESAASAAYESARSLGSQAIIDGSFIRLKNLSLSYQLPGRVNNILHTSNCRIYFQGQNLLTFSNFNGLDPENMNFYSLPPLRVLTAGFQITF